MSMFSFLLQRTRRKRPSREPSPRSLSLKRTIKKTKKRTLRDTKKLATKIMSRHSSRRSVASSLSDDYHPQSHSLRDMPCHLVRQITHVLFTMPGDAGDRSQVQWTSKQQSEVEQLNPVLRRQRPNSVFHRVAESVKPNSIISAMSSTGGNSAGDRRRGSIMSMISMSMNGNNNTNNNSSKNGTANLCIAHKQLNAQLVRELMVLVANEFTVRVDSYRRHLNRVRHQAIVDEWVHRMDAVTVMWMGADAFQQHFGQKIVAGTRSVPKHQPASRSSSSPCEACIIADIAGGKQVLFDLWSSLRVRAATNAVLREPHPEPRLLQFVEAWNDLHVMYRTPGWCREVLTSESDKLVAAILEYRANITARREDQIRKREEAGKAPLRQSRRSALRNQQGIPVPRVATRRHNPGTRLRDIEHDSPFVVEVNPCVVNSPQPFEEEHPHPRRRRSSSSSGGGGGFEGPRYEVGLGIYDANAGNANPFNRYQNNQSDPFPSQYDQSEPRPRLARNVPSADGKYYWTTLPGRSRDSFWTSTSSLSSFTNPSAVPAPLGVLKEGAVGYEGEGFGANRATRVLPYNDKPLPPIPSQSSSVYSEDSEK